MCSPGLLESMETMAKLWLADTASSPLLLLLLSFAFSLGSGNAEGSSNGLGDFPLLVFFLCLLGFPIQCASPCSFSLFRYLPLRFCLRFSAPVPSGFGICFVLLWFFSLRLCLGRKLLVCAFQLGFCFFPVLFVCLFSFFLWLL